MKTHQDTEVRASFRGILPEFMKRYIRSLGVTIRGEAFAGDGWRANLHYSRLRVGSIELTEIEIRFRGDKQLIEDFLDRLRLKLMRNAG